MSNETLSVGTSCFTYRIYQRETKAEVFEGSFKKLIIPIGANIVFTQKLDKAWIIIDTVVVKPFTSPPALIVR